MDEKVSPVSFDTSQASISMKPGQVPYDVYRACMEAFGASMIVLCLLDFCRLMLAIRLVLPGKLFYLFKL